MRVTKVSLLTEETEAIQFFLRNAPSHAAYSVRAIDGLDSDEIIPRFYGFSKDGKKKFYEFRLKPRTVVIRVVLNPNYALSEIVSDIRDELYRSIAASRTGVVQLQFHSGALTVSSLFGHVIKFEVAYFSQTPELQITIRCDDPTFRGVSPILMEPPELQDVNPVIVSDDMSTAPHGFEMQMTVTASISELTVQDTATSPEWDFVVIPDTNFLVGDTIHISSEFTRKSLYMVRAGVTTHLLDKIVPTSIWPIIFPKFTQLHFVQMASLNLDWIQFYPAYWGV